MALREQTEQHVSCISILKVLLAQANRLQHFGLQSYFHCKVLLQHRLERFLGQTQHQNCNLCILPQDAQVFASFLLCPKDQFY